MANVPSVQQVPPTPSLRASLEPLVSTPTEPIIGNHGYEGERELRLWTPPLAISAIDHAHAIEALAAYRLWLVPAEQQAISARIASMLVHFYVPGADADVHAAVASDWITLLAPFPQRVVDAVCLEWLGSEIRRPLPAQIVGRCRERVAVPRKVAARLEVLAAMEPQGGLV